MYYKGEGVVGAATSAYEVEKDKPVANIAAYNCIIIIIICGHFRTLPVAANRIQRSLCVALYKKLLVFLNAHSQSVRVINSPSGTREEMNIVWNNIK